MKFHQLNKSLGQPTKTKCINCNGDLRQLQNIHASINNEGRMQYTKLTNEKKHEEHEIKMGIMNPHNSHDIILSNTL